LTTKREESIRRRESKREPKLFFFVTLGEPENDKYRRLAHV
jgi:hypothetical protein